MNTNPNLAGTLLSPPFCCVSFDERLTAAIDYRQTEMSSAPEMREALLDETHPEHKQARKLAVNQLTAGLGLCRLGGMTISEALLPWVESMEKAHPEISSHNAEAESLADDLRNGKLWEGDCARRIGVISENLTAARQAAANDR